MDGQGLLKEAADPWLPSAPSGDIAEQCSAVAPVGTQIHLALHLDAAGIIHGVCQMRSFIQQKAEVSLYHPVSAGLTIP